MIKDNFEVENYRAQNSRWPGEGQVILAQYDDESVTVYQAYNKSIGQYAATNGAFGGEFSFTRMTWIKPNFLWMMYRSGWGTKENQEVTLAIKVRRAEFDNILKLAVPSSFDEEQYKSREEWQVHVKESDVRLQWDPDHDPLGEKQNRRAIQLGLRGSAVQSFARDWLLGISDISDFVSEQRENITSGSIDLLYTPKELVYLPTDESLHEKLGLCTG
ncbi:DUF4291 domain-containing protein [bacterium]|nr:DUF4291 domain-containing protein [bacterium]